MNMAYNVRLLKYSKLFTIFICSLVQICFYMKNQQSTQIFAPCSISDFIHFYLMFGLILYVF